MGLFNDLKEGILNNWKTIMTVITTISILWVMSHAFGDFKRYYTEHYNVSESFEAANLAVSCNSTLCFLVVMCSTILK